MESAVQDLIPNPKEASATVEVGQKTEPPAEAITQDQTNGESAETASLQVEPTAPAQLKDDEPARRGLLSRLLRRSDY
jgi:hypothetical protein